MQVAKQLPKLCVRFHEDVQRLSADFLAQQHRHYYVTPTSYLELLTSYKTLLAKKQDEVTWPCQQHGACWLFCHAHGRQLGVCPEVALDVTVRACCTSHTPPTLT